MITPNKRPCTNANNLLNVDILNVEVSHSNIYEPFPFFRPNQKNQMLPKAILNNHIVSFFTFREQSNTLTLISKAFNDLATFARNEQVWRDHVVYFYEVPPAIKVFNSSQNIYNHFFPKPHGGFQITEYFYWKMAQDKKNQGKPFAVDISAISNKIQMIRKIWVGENYNHNFRLALIGNNQIKTISAFIDTFLCSSGALLNTIAETCQNLTQLTLKFKKSSPVVCQNFGSQGNCLGAILQNCNQLDKLDLHLTDIGNLKYINNSIDCYSLNYIPLKYLQLRGSFVETTSLNEELAKLLQKSSQLLEINFIDTQSYKPYHAYRWCIDFPLTIIAKYCLNLSSMHIGDDIMATDESFAQVLSSCKHLTYLSHLSTEKNGLTEKTFVNLLQHPSIECVSISMHISSSILNLNEQYRCPSVISFCFDDSFGSMDTDPSLIIKISTMFFPNLTSVNIWTRERVITDHDIISLITNCPIRRLNLSFFDNNYFTETSLKTLVQFPNLKDVYISIYTKMDNTKYENLKNELSSETKVNLLQNQTENSIYFDTTHASLISREERISIPKCIELFKNNQKKLVLEPITLI